MKVMAAYLGVILIWSTTPLAIKFSTDSLSFVTAVGLRMSSAALLCVLIMSVLGQSVRWDKASLAAYAAGNLGVFGAMSLGYFAVGFIPSGLMSVMFGIAPLLSGLMAHYLLGEDKGSILRQAALLLGVAGLAFVFQGAINLQASALPGLIAALLAACLFALSGVLVKRYAGHLGAMEHTTGSLLLSLPLFFLSWLLFDGHLPNDISAKSLISVSYLSVLGSVVGFMLYFYALQALGPTQVALIPLITPILALCLGHWFDNEIIAPTTLFGGVLIFLALAGYQFGDRLYRRFRPRRVAFNG